MSREPRKLEFPTHQLAIKDIFGSLTQREKLYAHYLSRAAWHGGRIIMRQTSPEAIGIFDFILELHRSCKGQWKDLLGRCGIAAEDLDAFLDYAALFLCNLGNYYCEGGQKFVPDVSADVLEKIGNASTMAKEILKQISEPMLSPLPIGLGFPSDSALSTYYPGTAWITREEIAIISRTLGKHGIEQENTRLRKVPGSNGPTFEVLQASVETSRLADEYQANEIGAVVKIVKGDHANELSNICASLSEAKKYTANEKQSAIISDYIRSFQTGSLDAYRESQKAWVTDTSPRVESVMVFVEPYRDPYGVRGEWEGIVCISDPKETERLMRFVNKATHFIRLLPWAVPGENNGMGPFEKTLFQAPDFNSLHALTVCRSMVHEAANLPNYNDIRETCGFKNFILVNRLSANNDPTIPCHYLPPAEVDQFRQCAHLVRFVCSSIHELLGHGTGKLLSEVSPGNYNFDKTNPPINPLTKLPVDSWYLPGQTWTGVFEDIAPSVEECRASLVSQYLIDNKELLAIFGYTESTPVTADDLIYNTYLQIGTEGIQALEYYNAENKTWGEAHRRGNFATLKHLILEGAGVISIEQNSANKDLFVHVDRSKILSHGKPALGHFLSRLHIWRCIADAKSCWDLYERLSVVDGKYEEWRQIVCSKPDKRWKFVQANTFLHGENVELKTYEESNEGIIQSWAERAV